MNMHVLSCLLSGRPRMVCARGPGQAPIMAFVAPLLISGVLARPLSSQTTDLFAGTPFAGSDVRVVGRDLELGLVLSAAVTRDGSLLVIDRSVSRVYRINGDGKLLQTYGGPGGGPGEFGLPYRAVELSDGAVLIYDLSNSQFSEFARGGRFVRRWTTNTSIVALTELVPLDQRRFAISGIVRDSRAGTRAVHIFDSAFQLVRSFGELSPARSRQALETWGSGGLRRTPDGLLLYSRRVPYELNWFTADGERRRRVVVPKRVMDYVDDAFVIATSGNTQTMRLNPRAVSAGVASALPDGRMLSARAVGQRPIWDLLSPTGRLQWSGPRPAHVFGLIGVDGSTARLWFIGETGNGEPVFYSVRLAGQLTR